MTTRRRALATTTGLVAAAALALGAAAPVSAGEQAQPPAADASVECRDGEGWILVTIVDDSAEVFNVDIDEVRVDSAIPATDGSPNAYGPYADGDHQVVVEWLVGQNLQPTSLLRNAPLPSSEVILDETVTVDCVADVTEGPTTTAIAGSGGQIPATGQSSSMLLAGGTLLLVLGTGLLVVRRRPGRA